MSKVISKVVGAVQKVVAYVRGNYATAIAWVRSKQIVTHADVVKYYISLGKKESAAIASATVLLSPRQEDSKRGKLGNSLGNLSADGIHYYMIPLAIKKGEDKRFRFHLCTPAEVAARTALAAKRVMPKSRKVTAKTAKKTTKVVAAKKTNKVAKKTAKKAKPVIKPVAQQKTATPAAPATVEAPAPATVEASVTTPPDTNTTPTV